MIIAILFLAAAGGAIAYLGDWVGLYMGKRRLSLFGLRPRSTARLFTVVVGMSIALFTFAMLLAIDSGFRVALRNGTELMRTNLRLSHRNRLLEAQVAAKSAAAQSAQDAATAALAARDQAVGQYRSADLHLSRAKEAGAAALVHLAAARQALGRTSRSLASTRGRLAHAQLASNRLQSKITSEQAIIQQLGPILASVASNHIAALQSALLYRNGQEMGRTVIDSDQTTANIRQEISAFLLRLSVKGQAAGLARGSNGRTVQIADVAVLREGNTAGPDARTASMPTLHGEMDNIDALAEQIRAYEHGAGAVVLIAQAYGNAFAGEPAIITLRPYGDHLVLTKGAQLAQLTIPVSDDAQGKVIADLQELLDMARSSAMNAGVIPVENPQVHESDLGAVKLGELFSVADAVRRIHGPAVVTATAAQDTHSADELVLHFSVVPQSAVFSGAGSL